MKDINKKLDSIAWLVFTGVGTILAAMLGMAIRLEGDEPSIIIAVFFGFLAFVFLYQFATYKRWFGKEE